MQNAMPKVIPSSLVPPVDFDSIDVNDILDILKYLMIKNNTKLRLDLLKNVYWIIKHFRNKKFWWVIRF